MPNEIKIKKTEVWKSSSDWPKVIVSDRARAQNNWLPGFLLNRLFKSCECQQAYSKHHIAECFTCLSVQGRSHKQSLLNFVSSVPLYLLIQEFISVPKPLLSSAQRQSAAHPTTPLTGNPAALPCPGSSRMHHWILHISADGLWTRMSAVVCLSWIQVVTCPGAIPTGAHNQALSSEAQVREKSEVIIQTSLAFLSFHGLHLPSCHPKCFSTKNKYINNNRNNNIQYLLPQLSLKKSVRVHVLELVQRRN